MDNTYIPRALQRMKMRTLWCLLSVCLLILVASQGIGIMMRFASGICLAALAAQTASGARILQSNDDGWAELYVRSFNDALNAAGHDVVLSCPAENKSGTSSLHRYSPTQ